MREIKFRGKSSQIGEWVYGDLIHNSRGEITWIMPFDGAATYIPVIPETVGQFTGLCDKNGVEIYKGDILNGSCTKPIGKSPYGDTLLYFRAADSEIIGNIHDNPELLAES